MNTSHEPFRWGRAIIIVLGNTLGIASFTGLITSIVFSVMKPAPLNYLICAQIIGFGLSSPIFCGFAAHLAQRHPMRHVGAILIVLSTASLGDVFGRHGISLVALTYIAVFVVAGWVGGYFITQRRG